MGDGQGVGDDDFWRRFEITEDVVDHLNFSVDDVEIQQKSHIVISKMFRNLSFSRKQIIFPMFFFGG